MICDFCSDCIKSKQLNISDDLLQDILEVLLFRKLCPVNMFKICNKCVEQIKNSFNFKSQCLLIEDLIFPYIKENPGEKISMVDVYCKENPKMVYIKKFCVCRMCMDIIENDNASCLQITLEENGLEEVFKEYFTEMNVEVTSNPQICSVCTENLRCFAELVQILENKFNQMTNDTLKKTANLKNEFSNLVSHYGPKKETQEEEQQNSFSCSICSYSTKSTQTLNYHITVHHRKILTCKLCPFVSKSEISMKYHRIKLHNSDEVFKCDKCLFTTKRDSSFRKHCYIHTRQTPFICHLCKVQVSRQDQLDIHIKLKHGNPNKLKCTHCDFTTIYTKSLQIHLRSHTSEKPFHCNTCDYKTNRKDSLQRHAKKHENNEHSTTYKCGQCSYETRDKNSLKIHFVSHTKKGWEYFCSICKAKFKYTRDHLAHLKEVHKGKGVYICEYCSFESVNKSSLRTHITKFHVKANQLKCRYCKTKYNKRDDLDRHILEKHKNISQVFNCSHCNYTTKVQLLLETHTLYNHIGFQNAAKEAKVSSDQNSD